MQENIIKNYKQTVLILSGKSKAGKTTTRKLLQKTSPLGFIVLSPDLFATEWPMTFAKYDPTEEFKPYPQYDRYFSLLDSEGNFKFEMGPDFDKYYNVRFVVFDYFVKTGHNIIIEDTFEDLTDLDNYLRSVDPDKVEVYIVRLVADIETLSERGFIRDGGQYNLADTNVNFVDLTIDTTQFAPEEVANQILDYIESNDPKAVHDVENGIVVKDPMDFSVLS